MNYDTKNYVDIHKLRKKCAKATGLHNTFSGKKNSTSNISSADAADSYSKYEEELQIQKICEQTRIEDLVERIPPLATLLVELSSTNDSSTVETANEIALELKGWGETLKLAIDEFDLDRSNIEVSEQQLQDLGALQTLVRGAINQYEEKPKPPAKESVPQTQDALLMEFDLVSDELFANSAAVVPKKATTQSTAVFNPFESSNHAICQAPVDPFLEPFNSQPQQQSTGVDPFADPFADPFVHPNQTLGYQNQQLALNHKIQMEIYSRSSQQPSKTHHQQLQMFDPFSTIQRTA